MICTDVPIWNDCPFRQHVPQEVTIRRGSMKGYPDAVLVFEIGNGSRHVDVQMTWPEKHNNSLEILTEILDPLLQSLCGRKHIA